MEEVVQCQADPEVLFDDSFMQPCLLRGITKQNTAVLLRCISVLPADFFDEVIDPRYRLLRLL